MRWVNGVDLEYTDGWLKERQEEPFSPNQPAGVHYDYQVDAPVAAIYSQLRSQFESPWELTGGLRLEYTYYDYDNRTDDGPACAPEASACRFYRHNERSWHRLPPGKPFQTPESRERTDRSGHSAAR